MKTVTVNASRRYEVQIGSGLLSTAGQTVRQLTKAEKICIVSDSNVFPIYGEQVLNSLNNAGLETCSFVFLAGENSKNMDTYQKILQFLIENQITRSDCVLALGGGVVGDLAGFAAATYLRGISYFQLPTSLLAMVDASVGGKTAIDLPGGKNQCGAFWQPTAVLCDTDTLHTLPDDCLRDGCAEVIKYAVLFDEELFSHLEEHGSHFCQEEVISRCIAHKQAVVDADEFDQGHRMLLNLGHTIGHAIEYASNYKVSHGSAVAIGLAMLCRACGCRDKARILSLLEAFSLPTTTYYAPETLFAAALSDKKRSGDSIRLVTPHAIGDCRITLTSLESFQTLIEEGM